MLKEGGDLLSGLPAAGHGANHEGSAVGRIAADEYVLRVLGMLGLQEAHGEEDELGLDDLRLTLLDHYRTTTFRIWFPIDFLNFHTCQFAVLTEEFEGVDVPTSDASLLMRRGGLQRARPVRPRILRVVWSLDRTRHNLYLRNTLATLTVSSADAVGTSIATTYHEHILTLGTDELSRLTPRPLY